MITCEEGIATGRLLPAHTTRNNWTLIYFFLRTTGYRREHEGKFFHEGKAACIMQQAPLLAAATNSYGYGETKLKNENLQNKTSGSIESYGFFFYGIYLRQDQTERKFL